MVPSGAATARSAAPDGGRVCGQMLSDLPAGPLRVLDLLRSRQESGDMAKAGTEKDLIEHIGAGDVSAAEKLFELAAAGNEEAKATALRLIADGVHNRRESSLEAAREAFWKRLKSTVKAIDADGPLNESAVAELLRKASPLTKCEIVQALGTEAYLYRLKGRLDKAEATLAKALETAGTCRQCQLDLLRRRAELRGSQGRYSEGHDDADAAVRGYRDLGGPGHDLHGEGEANSLSVRGMHRYDLGDLHGSIADFGRVLQILAPRRTPDLFAYGVMNLAIPLRKSGPEGREQALQLIVVVRQKFRGVLNGTLPRAKLDWLEGSLKLSLKCRFRCRWVRLLQRAMEDFARMGMDAEAMAVMADLALVKYPNRDEIKALFVVPEIKDLVIGKRFREPLEELFHATKERTFRSTPRLGESIGRLRQVAEKSPGVLPCFVSQ